MTRPLSVREERWMLVTLAGIQFTHILDFMIMMPLGPQFTRLFGIDAAQFGLLVSAYTFAAGVSGVLAALFVDRFERKRLLLALFALFALATLACALAPGYHALLLARVAAGMFGGVLSALTHTIVGDLVPEHRRGRAIGVVMTAFSVSTVAGVPLGLTIAAHAGWRWTFAFVAALAVVFFVLALRVLPRVHGHLAHPRAHPVVELLRVARQPNHLRAFAFTLIMIFAGFSVIPYISLYLVLNVGVRESELPLIYIAGGLATLFTARLIGRWSDRYGKRRVFRLVAAGSIVPLLALTHLPPVALWVAIAGSVLFFVLISGRMIPGMAIVTSSAAPGMRGTFLSLNSAVMQVGSGAAALVAGLIVQRAPAAAGGQLLNYPWVGYLAVACTLVAMAWVARIEVLDARPGVAVEPGPDAT